MLRLGACHGVTLGRVTRTCHSAPARNPQSIIDFGGSGGWRTWQVPGYRYTIVLCRRNVMPIRDESN